MPLLTLKQLGTLFIILNLGNRTFSRSMEFLHILITWKLNKMNCVPCGNIYTGKLVTLSLFLFHLKKLSFHFIS